jgi:hypothetical protein
VKLRDSVIIVQGGGRAHTPEDDVLGVRTVLRVQLTDEQRDRIGISADRDLAQCVMRLCDALTEAEARLTAENQRATRVRCCFAGVSMACPVHEISP